MSGTARTGLTTRVHAIVLGKVQGVFFRASTRQQALSLGLVGWVRNRDDGAVELEAEGPVDTVDALVQWCHSGPPAARVTRVITSERDPTGSEGDFEIRR